MDINLWSKVSTPNSAVPKVMYKKLLRAKVVILSYIYDVLLQINDFNLEIGSFKTVFLEHEIYY